MLPDQPESSAGAEQALPDAAPVAETTPEPIAEQEGEAPKAQPETLNAAEELEKLRKAKARDDRRIGKLTAVKYQAQKEAEELRKRLSEYETKKPTGTEKPKESDFEGRPYNDYVEALADWKFEQRISERDKKSTDETVKQRNTEYIREREDLMDDNGEKAAKEIHDFNTVMNEYQAELRGMAPHVRLALLDAENGAFALYQLLKEETLESLNEMSERRVNQIVGKAEDRALAALKSKPVSKTPAPLKPNTGTGSASKEITASSSVKDILKWVQS